MRLALGALAAVVAAVLLSVALIRPPSSPTIPRSEKVDSWTLQLCEDAINGTHAQLLTLPADQRSEVLQVTNYCNRLAINTNNLATDPEGFN